MTVLFIAFLISYHPLCFWIQDLRTQRWIPALGALWYDTSVKIQFICGLISVWRTGAKNHGVTAPRCLRDKAQSPQPDKYGPPYAGLATISFGKTFSHCLFTQTLCYSQCDLLTAPWRHIYSTGLPILILTLSNIYRSSSLSTKFFWKFPKIFIAA